MLHKTSKSNIYLTGFMGSGKSTIGKILSKKMKWNFYDLDQVIETKTQKTIPQIFEMKGEAYFRKLESKYLKSLCRKKNAVIALGGGTLLDKQNLKQVQSTGVLVYFKLDFATLYRRIEKTNRPLVKKQTKKQIKELFQRRSVHYKKSDFYISVGGKSKAEIIQSLLNKRHSITIKTISRSGLSEHVIANIINIKNAFQGKK